MGFLKNKITLIALLLVQSLLCIVAFNKLLIYNGKNIFSLYGDGLKNYFTFYSYITAKPNGSFFLYDKMNYPNGDYIFYTDNTPALSVPLKLIHLYLFDLTPYLFYLHNLYFIAGIVVATYFIYKILTLLLENKYLIFILSVCLVWINPQMLRYMMHFNLASAWILLASLYLSIKIYQTPLEKLSPSKYHFYLLLLTIYATFTHIYFLLIIGLNLAGFGLFWLLKEYKNWQQALPKIGIYGLFYVIAFGISFGIIRMIDTFYALRRTGTEGYDWGPLKNSLSSLICHRDWNFVKFFIAPNHATGIESDLYLGAFALYGAFFLGLLVFLGKIDKQEIKRWVTEKPLLTIVFGTGLMAFIISLGEVTVFGGNEYKYYNYLNPLLFLYNLTERVSQFRCMGRMGWLFFWTFNIAIAYLLEKYYQAERTPIRMVLPAILCLMLVFDTRDSIRNQNGMYVKNPFLKENIGPDFYSLFSSINPSDYQAIVSLPPYHVGSEDFSYTFDPEAEFFLKNLQLQIVTGLPNTSSLMSRTPVIHAKDYVTLFSNEPLSERFLSQFNDKKLLVLVKKDLQNPKNEVPKREPARTIFLNCMDFLKKEGLTSLGKTGDWELMAWDIKHKY